MTTGDFDVAIVGAGPAGASLACALSALPLRIALIEATPFAVSAEPGYDDRSLALNWAARRVLEGISLWDGIAAEATPIGEIHVSDRGHCGAARLFATACGIDALGYVVESRVLGHAFSARLPLLPNIETICPARLLAMESHPGVVRLRIGQDGRERSLAARLVVGADGAHSVVRRHGGIDAESVDYGQHAVIANVTPEFAHANRAWERFTAEGPLALLPMSGKRCALVWTIPSEDSARVLALTDAEFLAELQARFGNRLGRFQRAGMRSAYPLALVRARSYIGERLALIGNAAHAASGRRAGVQSWPARRCCARRTHRRRLRRRAGPRAERLLQQYQRSRQRDQQRTVAFTDGLIAYSPVISPR